MSEPEHVLIPFVWRNDTKYLTPKYKVGDTLAVVNNPKIKGVVIAVIRVSEIRYRIRVPIKWDGVNHYGYLTYSENEVINIATGPHVNQEEERMFNVVYLDEEAVTERHVELLTMPYTRVSHKFVNIYDYHSNTVYVAQTSLVLPGNKPSFRCGPEKVLAVEYSGDVEELLKHIPEPVNRAEVKVYSTVGPTIIVSANNEHFLFGTKDYSGYAVTSDFDEIFYIGKVSVNGLVKPVFIPGIGYCIRIIANHETYLPYSTGQWMTPVTLDNPENLPRATLLKLVDEDGQLNHFQIPSPVVKALDIKSELTDDLGYSLRTWIYPIQEDNKVVSTPYLYSFQVNFSRLDKSDKYVSSNGGGVTFVPGSGEVEKHFNLGPSVGEAKVTFACIKHLERSYARSVR